MTWDWAKGIYSGMGNANLIESNSAGFTKSPTDPELIENVGRTRSVDPLAFSIVYLDASASQWDLVDAWRTREYMVGQATILYPGFGDINNHAQVQQGMDYADWIERSCYKPGRAQLHYGKGKTFWQAMDEPEPKPQRSRASSRDRLAALASTSLQMPKK